MTKQQTSSLLQSRESRLFLFLAALFLTNALVAEMIGVKMFSVEKLLGIPPLDFPFIGESRLSLNMSVGILLWPVVFILSDLINEYFGKSGVKRISWMAAGMIAYGFVLILSGTHLPAADFWLEVNSTDHAGRPFDIDYAYNTIFRQGMGIIVGSITAFLVGQLIDMYVFHYLRKATKNKKLWLRATGSTVVSQFTDSFLILLIAFYWLGNWSLMQVLSVGLIQYFYKVSFAILLTPLIYLVHNWIDRYLGKERAAGLISDATEA